MRGQKVVGMDSEIFEISAKEVIVEVVDGATGKAYRRTLPIDYYENANGLVRRGRIWTAAFPSWCSTLPGECSGCRTSPAKARTRTPAVPTGKSK